MTEYSRVGSSTLKPIFSTYFDVIGSVGHRATITHGVLDLFGRILEHCLELIRQCISDALMASTIEGQLYYQFRKFWQKSIKLNIT